MRTVAIDDKVNVERFLRRDTALHLYAIGDLDDFFWPRTRWYGLEQAGEAGALRALFLLYDYEGSLPTLLALEESDPEAARTLLDELAPTLPARFYAHLSPALTGTLERSFVTEPRGAYRKMVLTAEAAGVTGAPAARTLGPRDLDAVTRFYATAYPGNWFDPRMLETGMYRALEDGGDLVAVAGVHVYSERYRVAALGNVATAPGRRGEGVAGAVTGALCRDLAAKVDLIGLNVAADNAAALRCYRRLGFEVKATYAEMMVHARR